MQPTPIPTPPPQCPITLLCAGCKMSGYEVHHAPENDLQTIYLISVGPDQNYCQLCLETRINQQFSEARSVEQRFIYFKEFESSFQLNEEPALAEQPAKEDEHRRVISSLRMRQTAINEQLSQTKEREAALKENIRSMEAEEDKFWENINKIEKRGAKLEEKSFHARFDKEIEMNMFQELGRTSVIHLFLGIRIEDDMGFVQNMAMGKRPDAQEVVWEEIAVGVGHLLMGLSLISLKYSYHFKRFDDIRLKGHLTEVMLIGSKKPNSLYRPKQFREVIQALLCEVDSLANHILEAQNREYSEEFKLPYGINQAEMKILDFYIDPFRLEERKRWVNWTKAMRYFLIDFNHLVSVFAIADRNL